MLEKIVRERRASLAPSQAGNMGPHIMVSEASVGDFGEPFLYIAPRRASTQSMGPVVVPVSIILRCSISPYQNLRHCILITARVVL